MKPMVAFALLPVCILLLACSPAKPTSQSVTSPPASPTLQATSVPSSNEFPIAPSVTTPSGTSQQVSGTATDVLNVRAGPGLNYAIKGQLKQGDTITIIGKSADGLWWQFRGGWVSAAYVRVSGDPAVVPVSTPFPTALDMSSYCPCRGI